MRKRKIGAISQEFKDTWPQTEKRSGSYVGKRMFKQAMFQLDEKDIRYFQCIIPKVKIFSPLPYAKQCLPLCFYLGGNPKGIIYRTRFQ